MHDHRLASLHDRSDRTHTQLKVRLFHRRCLEPSCSPYHQGVQLIIPIQQRTLIGVKDLDRDIQQRLEDLIHVQMLH